MKDFLTINDTFIPQILIEEKDFIVVYKPPRMHSSPINNSRKTSVQETTVHKGSVLDWCSREYPEIADLHGRKPGEGGLLHRLDYETQGIMLLARTLPGMEALLEQQKQGKIIKEYSALTSESETMLPGFPRENPKIPSKDIVSFVTQPVSQMTQPQFRITSAFRAYGSGRKVVRPVLEGKPYITEIIETGTVLSGINFFRLSISKGFRHQIRCHLAWLGMPIINDDLYGGISFGNGLLGLRASSISFIDPASKKELTYSIPSLVYEMAGPAKLSGAC